MDKGTLVRAGLGALFIGAGLALMLSATRRLTPCTDCEDEAISQTIDKVAAASAELAENDD